MLQNHGVIPSQFSLGGPIYFKDAHKTPPLMCQPSVDTPQYAAHRSLQTGYAEYRCRAIGTRSKEHLGKLIELLLPVITRHYNFFMKSTGYKSFSNRRLLRVDIGVESPGDFSHLLFDHFEAEQFKRLATYDEMLMVTDFKNESNGFASFCRQILKGSRPEAQFVSERLSARAISLCEVALDNSLTAPPMEHSLQKSLLTLLNDIAPGTALTSVASEPDVSNGFSLKPLAGMSDERRYRQNWRILKNIVLEKRSAAIRRHSISPLRRILWRSISSAPSFTR